MRVWCPLGSVRAAITQGLGGSSGSGGSGDSRGSGSGGSGGSADSRSSGTDIWTHITSTSPSACVMSVMSVRGSVGEGGVGQAGQANGAERPYTGVDGLRLLAPAGASEQEGAGTGGDAGVGGRAEGGQGLLPCRVPCRLTTFQTSQACPPDAAEAIADSGYHTAGVPPNTPCCAHNIPPWLLQPVPDAPWVPNLFCLLLTAKEVAEGLGALHACCPPIVHNEWVGGERAWVCLGGEKLWVGGGAGREETGGRVYTCVCISHPSPLAAPCFEPLAPHPPSDLGLTPAPISPSLIPIL